MATTEQYLKEIIKQKETLVQTLKDNGVEAQSEETFNTLIPKTSTIRPEPEQGFVVEEWTKQANSGSKVPKVIRTIGYEVLPTFGFACISPGFGSPCGFTGDVTEVYLNEGLTDTGRYTFYSSAGTSSVNRLKTVHWPSTIQKIGSYTFYNNGKLEMSELPETITSIGSYAFYNCDGVTFKNIPDAVNSIGEYALCCSTGLTELTLNAESVGNYGLYNNPNLTTLHFKKPVSLGDYALYGNSKLTNLNTENIITAGSNAFVNVPLEDFKFDSWGSVIPKLAFSDVPTLKIKTLPSHITGLRDGSFRNDKGITQLSCYITNASDGSSYWYPFTGCSNIKALYFAAPWDANTQTRSRYIGSGCTGLKYLYINMPRTEVEAMPGYSYKFVNKAAQEVTIICNDDADWITKEEFDAIDWTTR